MTTTVASSATSELMRKTLILAKSELSNYKKADNQVNNSTMTRQANATKSASLTATNKK